MAIIKIKRAERHRFVTLQKECLENQNLSFRAKGLWAYLMSLPDNWEVNLKDLSNRSKEGREATRSALRELKEHGYVVHRYRRKNNRVHGMECFVFEEPQHQSRDNENDINEQEHCGKAVNEIANPVENDDIAYTQESVPKRGMGDDFQEPCSWEARSKRAKNSPLINNNIIKNIYNEKTAAAMEGGEREHYERQNHELSAAAADVKKLNNLDLVIGDRLTDKQNEKIQQSVNLLKQYFPDVQAHEIQKAIEFEILDLKKFKGAGRDFIKKLNTINKQIRLGRWTMPVGMLLEEEQQRLVTSRKYELELLEAESDLDHWQKLREQTEKRLRQRGETEDDQLAQIDKIILAASKKVDRCRRVQSVKTQPHAS